MRLALGFALGLASAACGNALAPPTSPSETLVLRRETAHFRILTGEVAPATWADVESRLEANYARVLSDLRVAAIGVVTVKIWSSESAFLTELERTLGQRYPATGYVVAGRELRVLQTANVASASVHEFSHVVTLEVNPRAANNPRWLWETTALFENGERVDPRTLTYLQNGPYPTLSQLSVDVNVSQQIYQVGYLLGAFIVERWGQDGLVELIRTNGDIPRVTGLTVSEFEQQWIAYVRLAG